MNCPDCAREMNTCDGGFFCASPSCWKFHATAGNELRPSYRTGPPVTAGGTETADRSISAGQSAKYGSKPQERNGLQFASMKEAQRYDDLCLLESSGEITALEVHPEYRMEVNGCLVGKYTPDFRYVENGSLIVEDVKSTATKHTAYRLRKRLMKAIFGIEIRET